ncbi:MAG TPA: right-handed parallel beta-helix repeat-containing protein [Gaiellaceae bacterium]|nr:right-handed parallel beta-helix repeat-containing protein [Gaiellaceae bacterium]
MATVLAALAAPHHAAAATCNHYASTTGNDHGPGTATQPYRSANRLVHSLPNGGTGCLSGVFTERVVITHPVNLRGPATIVGGVTITSAAPGTRVTNLTIRGYGAGRAVVLVRADRVRIAGNHITGRGYLNRNTACVLLSGSRGPVIDSNRIETCSRASVRNLSAPGVFVGSAYGARVSNNLIVHTTGYGIVLGPNAQRTRVVHNLVDGNSGSLLITGNAKTSSSHNTVESNIFSNAGGNNVKATWSGIVGRGNAVVANCVWHGFGGNFDAPGVHLEGNIVTSPRYVDRPSDYTVQAPPCLAKRPAIVAAHLTPLPPFRVTFHVKALPKRVRILRLGLSGLVSGTSVQAHCVAGCTGSWTAKAHGATANMTSFEGRWLPVGAVIEVREALAGHTGALARIRVVGLPNGLVITHGAVS